MIPFFFFYIVLTGTSQHHHTMHPAMQHYMYHTGVGVTGGLHQGFAPPPAPPPIHPHSHSHSHSHHMASLQGLQLAATTNAMVSWISRFFYSSFLIFFIRHKFKYIHMIYVRSFTRLHFFFFFSPSAMMVYHLEVYVYLYINSIFRIMGKELWDTMLRLYFFFSSFSLFSFPQSLESYYCFFFL